MPTDEERKNDLGVARAAEVLAESRERFVVTMAALESEIMHTLDWRAWVKRRLRLAMVLAFGVGLYLGRRRNPKKENHPMKLQDIRNMDKDDFLGILGLETKHSFTNQLLGTLGTFGIGLVVGAGVALLLAPKSGSELRHDVRAKLHRDGKTTDASGREPRDTDKAGLIETIARGQ